MDLKVRHLLGIAPRLDPLVIGVFIIGIPVDPVTLADVGDPAVERVDRRPVVEVPRLAERPVEIDLHRRAAFVFRSRILRGKAVGLPPLLPVPLVAANRGVLDEYGTHGHRRNVDRYGELRVRAGIGQTQRYVEVTRCHEAALQPRALLLGARLVAIDKLAAELDRRSVRPVLGQLERRGRRDEKLVLRLEPDPFAGRLPGVVRRLHLDPVVSEIGVEARLDREEVLLENMPQAERRGLGDRVVTARNGDPRIVVRRDGPLQFPSDLEVVALLADRGALGPVAGPAEVFGIDARRFHLVAETHPVRPHGGLVDRDLRRGCTPCQQRRHHREKQGNLFHITAAFALDFRPTNL